MPDNASETFTLGQAGKTRESQFFKAGGENPVDSEDEQYVHSSAFEVKPMHGSSQSEDTLLDQNLLNRSQARGTVIHQTT